MACNPCHSTNGYASHQAPFPRPPAQPLPPLLPLPAQAVPGAASAPIAVAAPSRKRVAPATATGPEGEEWAAGTDSLYSVSPPPSSVPMPTSLLLTVTAARKAPMASCCTVEVAGAVGCGGVDVGATDELRRLLRL